MLNFCTLTMSFEGQHLSSVSYKTISYLKVTERMDILIKTKLCVGLPTLFFSIPEDHKYTQLQLARLRSPSSDISTWPQIQVWNILEEQKKDHKLALCLSRWFRNEDRFRRALGQNILEFLRKYEQFYSVYNVTKKINHSDSYLFLKMSPNGFTENIFY